MGRFVNLLEDGDYTNEWESRAIGTIHNKCFGHAKYYIPYPTLMFKVNHIASQAFRSYTPGESTNKIIWK